MCKHRRTHIYDILEWTRVKIHGAKFGSEHCVSEVCGSVFFLLRSCPRSYVDWFLAAPGLSVSVFCDSRAVRIRVLWFRSSPGLVRIVALLFQMRDRCCVAPLSSELCGLVRSSPGAVRIGVFMFLEASKRPAPDQGFATPELSASVPELSSEPS